MRRHASTTLLAAALAFAKASAFTVPCNKASSARNRCRPLFSDIDDNNNDNIYDPNRWISSDEENSLADGTWEDTLARREDGSLWSSFESSDDDSEINSSAIDSSTDVDIDGGEEAWLDSLQNIAAEEINFMTKEADRADKARQMEEMGFSSESISATLGVATDTELETDEENPLFEAFKEETAKTGFGQVVDEVDMETVESHTQVEWDGEADEPIRSQHVYVDEVTCIGCTNCAMIAQSTFFMEGEHGRARVVSLSRELFLFIASLQVLIILFCNVALSSNNGEMMMKPLQWLFRLVLLTVSITCHTMS